MPRERRGGSTPLSPTTARGRGRRAPAGPSGLAAYTSRRCRSPGPPLPTPPSSSRSSSPPNASAAPIDDAVRHLSRRTRVPGFRPGKAPRRRPRATPRARRGPRRGRRAPRPGRLPRGARPGGHPAADQRRRRSRAGRGGQAAHLQGDRPGPPEVQLGDYKGFNFGPEIDTIDDARVDKVLEELRDQNATLAAVEGRGAQDGDYAVISFVGLARRRALRGRDVRADADHPRPGAADPGLRGQPARPRGRRLDRVRHHLPR